MKGLVMKMLVVNHQLYSKRNPNMITSQIVDNVQRTVTDLICLGIAIPMLVWIGTIYFLIQGEVTLTKWTGGFVVAFMLFPLYIFIKKEIKQIKYFENGNLEVTSKADRSKYWLFVFLSLFNFIFTITICTVLVRRMLYG